MGRTSAVIVLTVESARAHLGRELTSPTVSSADSSLASLHWFPSPTSTSLGRAVVVLDESPRGRDCDSNGRTGIQAASDKVYQGYSPRRVWSDPLLLTR